MIIMNITVPINRNRFPIVFAISLLITILLTLNLVYSKSDNMYMNGLFNWIFNSIILLVPLLYTIISFAEYIKTRFDKNAMLQLSDPYLYDNLSIFSCGKISWNDISDVEIVKAFKADFLVIKLIDPGKYLADRNFLQRYVLKKYIKKWGSPIIISEKRVDYNLIELKKDILIHTTN
jgi:hypothetical protein